jgi:hypothetical protein
MLSFLKNLITFAREAAPAALQEQRALNSWLRKIPDGQGVLRVTANHAIEPVADLGQAFEGMMKHPVIAKFLRHKPKLILVQPESELPVIGKVVGARIYSNKIFMDTTTFDALTHDERVGLVAHELGHHLRLDTHARRTFRSLFSQSDPRMEMSADKIAVTITKHPEALDSAIKRLKEIHPDAALHDKKMHGGSVLDNIKAAMHHPLEMSYLPPEIRTDWIQSVGKKAMTDRGNHLEQQMERVLQKRHNATFPHQRPR